jgi:ATP synthase protein I
MSSTQSKTRDEGPTPVFKTYSVASVGLEMGLAVAIGALMGLWLDKTFDTRPWLLLLFIAFGIAAGFKGMLRAAREVKREFDEAPEAAVPEAAVPEAAVPEAEGDDGR